MTTSTEPASPPVATQEGLRANVLGLFDSIVMAVAGSALAIMATATVVATTIHAQSMTAADTSANN